ncbi:MAG: alpha/beta family hydrolase, partial [Bacteroidota bacterium]
MVQPQNLQFQATESSGNVSALLIKPKNAVCLYVFGHGAGAGMEHAFMEAMARQFAEVGIATL